MREITKAVFGALLNKEFMHIAETEGDAAARKATYFDLVWSMREKAMDERQRKRNRRFERYRPVHTLSTDGVKMMRSYIHEDDPAFILPLHGSDA